MSTSTSTLYGTTLNYKQQYKASQLYVQASHGVVCLLLVVTICAIMQFATSV